MSVLSVLLISLFVSACTMAYALGWLARLLALRLQIVDLPDGRRKSHQDPTPLLGGVAVFLSLLFCTPLIVAFPPTRLAAFLVSGVLFCILGIWDDIRSIQPRHKLAGQILASLPFALWGTSTTGVSIFGSNFELGVLTVLLLVLWIVALSNAFNLIDGVDGLSSVIGIIGAVSLAFVAIAEGNPGATCISVALAGCLFGFLGHNRPPARMFLGDAGSLCVGYLLAALFVEVFTTSSGKFQPILPAVLMAVPIFDTLVAMVRRRLRRHSLSRPDREHIHHRLMERPFTTHQVLLTIASLCVIFAGVMFAGWWFQSELLSASCALGILAVLVLTRVFGDREFSMLWRRLSETSVFQFVRSNRKLGKKQALTSISDEKSDLVLIPLPSERPDCSTQEQTDRERHAA